MIDDIPQSVMDEVDAEMKSEEKVTSARTVQTQYNVHVWGQLRELVANTYHKVYDLGDDSTSLPRNLGDVRVMFSEDFQSITEAYLESSITTTELLHE